MNVKKLLISLVLSATISAGLILSNGTFAPKTFAMGASNEKGAGAGDDDTDNSIVENSISESEDEDSEDTLMKQNNRHNKKPVRITPVKPIRMPQAQMPRYIRLFTNPNPIAPIHFHIYRPTTSAPTNQSRRITENSESLMNFQIFVHCDFYAVIHNLKILEKIPAMKSFLGSIDNCNGNIMELALKNMDTIRTIDQNLFDTIILKIRISDVLSPSSKIFLRHLVLAMRATR